MMHCASRFRHTSTPSVLTNALSSLRYLVVVEIPLFVNISALLGLARYDSDGDDESDDRKVYFMDWRPEVLPFSHTPTHPETLATCRAMPCTPPSPPLCITTLIMSLLHRRRVRPSDGRKVYFMDWRPEVSQELQKSTHSRPNVQ